MPAVDDEQTSVPDAPAPSTFVHDPGTSVTMDGPSLLSADAELQDPELHQEIELVSVLVLTASASGRRLTTAEIDRALGLSED